MIQSSIAPGLLLAVPQLIDPNFSRAVVLMVEHNDDGSFGLVINQPIEMSAGELLDSLNMPWTGDPEMLVGTGGPVQPDSGWLLHEPVLDLPANTSEVGNGGTLEISPGLLLSTSPESLRKLAESPPDRLRILLGYSGWGPGQLAAEMSHGSWIHADVDLDIIFDTPTDDIWDRAVRSLGIEPQAIIQGFGVH